MNVKLIIKKRKTLTLTFVDNGPGNGVFHDSLQIKSAISGRISEMAVSMSYNPSLWVELLCHGALFRG